MPKILMNPLQVESFAIQYMMASSFVRLLGSANVASVIHANHHFGVTNLGIIRLSYSYHGEPLHKYYCM